MMVLVVGWWSVAILTAGCHPDRLIAFRARITNHHDTTIPRSQLSPPPSLPASACKRCIITRNDCRSSPPRLKGCLAWHRRVQRGSAPVILTYLLSGLCRGSITPQSMQRARGWRRRPYRLAFLLASLLLVIFILSPPIATAADANPYTVLGLSRTASDKDIKKAYRKLSKLHHPDKSTDVNAASQFHEINTAYELLSDKDKRAQYDRYGRVDTQQQQQQQQQQQYGRQQQYANPWAYMQHQQQQQQQRYNDYQFNADSTAQALPHIRKLTTDNFDTLVSQHLLAQQRMAEVWLIYAYTTDCSPCTALQPHIARLSTILHTTGLYRVVKLGRVHSDYESALIRQLGVRTLPHITSIVQRPDGRRHSQALSYHSLSYDNLCTHIATQLIHTQPVTYLTTLAGTNRQRTVQLIKQRIETPQHITVPDLYILSTTTISPSLPIAYLIAFFASAFRYHYVYLPALLTASHTVAELAQELGVAVDGLQAGGVDNVYVKRGYHTSTLTHVLSADGQTNVDELVRRLQPWQWVAVPQLTAANYHSLCVNKRKVSTSLLQPSTTAALHRVKQCLVLLATSQQVADTTAAPLISQPTVLDMSSHTTQLVWLNPTIQSHWIAAYNTHAKQAASSAVLIRPHTGQYRLAPLHLSSDALVDWLVADSSATAAGGGGWRSMWVPLLESGGGGWLDVVLDWWEDVVGSSSGVLGWLSGGVVGGVLHSVGVWMLLLLGVGMFVFMMLLARA